MNLIVTGQVQSGKTTWCTKYSHWLIGRKFTVGGVLCREARRNNEKIGYDIVDIQTGRSVMFGRYASETCFPGETIGNYIISHEALEFANGVIQKALENRYDMIFIDEAGHLELAGKGIVEAAKIAYQKASNTTTVVRKSLLTAFLKYLHLKDPTVRFIIKDLELDTSYPPPERK